MLTAVAACRGRAQWVVASLRSLAPFFDGLRCLVCGVTYVGQATSIQPGVMTAARTSYSQPTDGANITMQLLRYGVLGLNWTCVHTESNKDVHVLSPHLRVSQLCDSSETRKSMTLVLFRCTLYCDTFIWNTDCWLINHTYIQSSKI